MEEKVTKVFLKKWFVKDEGVPDSCGFSLHLTQSDTEAFIQEYLDGLPARDPPPLSYEYADVGLLEVFVSDKVLSKIKGTKNGLRVYMDPKIELHLIM